MQVTTHAVINVLLETHGLSPLNVCQCLIHVDVMDKQTFAFNRDASYQAGGVYSTQIKGEQLTQPSVVVAAAGGEFTTKLPSIFEKYRMPDVESEKLVQAWNSNPMQFWQSQVNLAVWCATTGCPGAAAPGPSVECFQ